MVTDHPLILVFYVLIVKPVMNVCVDDILTWPWIGLTCAYDMVLQFHYQILTTLPPSLLG